VVVMPSFPLVVVVEVPSVPTVVVVVPFVPEEMVVVPSVS